jgi:hypothetical protein
MPDSPASSFCGVSLVHTSVEDLDPELFDGSGSDPLKMLIKLLSIRKGDFSRQHFQYFSFPANPEKTSELSVITT